MSLETLKALGVTIPYKAKYDNFIGGKWVAPVKGEYFDVISPITGKPYTKAARSSAEDVELALDAAHAKPQRLSALISYLKLQTASNRTWHLLRQQIPLIMVSQFVKR